MTLYHKDMVLSIHLQNKNWSICPESTKLWPFLCGHPKFLENLAFSQIGQYVEIFKLVPQAQFSANHPNSFFVD